ncbi:MAG: PAS domain S-box protein [Candidatus Sabulitectum sp.]|nr:PAS domain S-box protein [Candidatus Sabulitectum sp.]
MDEQNDSNMKSREYLFFQQMTDGIVLLDHNFRIEYANPSFLSLLHISSLAEVSGIDLYQFAATDEDQILMRERQNSSLLEVDFSWKNGKAIPVDISISPTVDQEGSVSGYIVVVRNNTFSRIDSNHLQLLLERYRDSALCGFDWLWEVDSSATFTFVSHSVRETMGYSPEELLGRTPFESMTAEEGEKVASTLNRIASRNEGFKNLVSRSKTKSGDEVVISTSGIPVFDKDGKLKGYRGGDRDITKEVRTAESLKNALASTQKILEELPVGVIVIDRNKQIMQINQRACTVTGRERDELVGEICHSAFCPSLVDKCPILDLEQRVDRAERFVLHKDGHKIPVVKSVIPVEIDSEDLLLEVFVDVSEIKSLKTDLNEKNREFSLALDSLNKSTGIAREQGLKRQKFFGSLVTEKVIALGGITGMVDLLLEEDHSDRQKDLFYGVQSNCRKLTNAVHLIQDSMGGISRKLPREPIEFRMGSFLEIVTTPFRDRATRKGVALEVRVDPLLPDLFYGPVLGLEEILQVLLDHSFSSESSGIIEIGVTSVSSEEETMDIRFSVSISGDGLSSEGLEQLLSDPDSPVRNSRISACREFANSVGGELSARNNPDSGSAFWLTIPLVPRKGEDARSEDVLGGVRILVLENDIQLRSVYFEMIKSMGCRVSVPADRPQALMQLREAAEIGDPFRIVVLDRDCPENEGIITSKLIKGDSCVGLETDIVCCSTRIHCEDVEAYQENGYTAILRKPLKLDTLRSCLIQIMSRSGENLPLITEYSLPESITCS